MGGHACLFSVIVGGLANPVRLRASSALGHGFVRAASCEARGAGLMTRGVGRGVRPWEWRPLLAALVLASCLAPGTPSAHPSDVASLHHQGDRRLEVGHVFNKTGVILENFTVDHVFWSGATQDAWGTPALVWHVRSLETHRFGAQRVNWTKDEWVRDSDGAVLRSTSHFRSASYPDRQSWDNRTYDGPCAAPHPRPDESAEVRCHWTVDRAFNGTTQSSDAWQNATWRSVGTTTIAGRTTAYNATVMLTTGDHLYARSWWADTECGWRELRRDTRAVQRDVQTVLVSLTCGTGSVDMFPADWQAPAGDLLAV